MAREGPGCLRGPAGYVKPLLVLVDDDPDTLTVLFDLLFSGGYRVIPVGNGESALEAIQRDKPQAVITDVRMPKMDGLELLGRLKNLHPELPVILLTGYGDQGMYHTALTLRAEAFISKPFAPEELLRVIAQVLRSTF